MNEQQRDLFQKFAAVASLFLLTAVFAVVSPSFLSVGNAMTVALQVTSIAYLGIGATMVIIAGGIDLSVGAVLALAGVVAALAVKAGAPVPVPVPVAMSAGVLAGALCGAVNGLAVTLLRLPPFIATLAMMLVARGVALQLTEAKAIGGLGDDFAELGNGALWRMVTIGADGFPDVAFPGIPYPVILMVVLAVAVAVLLRRTRLGRHLYSIGSNAEAARLSGVDVRGVTMFAYTASGLIAGMTGCVLASRLVTAQPSEGLMYELDAIAAAVIGGTSLSGGVGTVSGTLIGAFVIGILRNGLNMGGVSAFVQQIVIGLVILLTVWIDQLRHRR
jgi:ribose transport system permease protein